MCGNLEFSSVFDIKLASWLLDPDTDSEDLCFDKVVKGSAVVVSSSETSSFYSTLLCDMKKCLAASVEISNKIKAASLWGSLSFETNVTTFHWLTVSHSLLTLILLTADTNTL